MLNDSGYIRRSVHGGHCCGMTHIWKFPLSGPDAVLAAREVRLQVDWRALVAAYPSTYGAMLNDAYPEQTAGDRVKAMISNIQDTQYHVRGRPGGIIEIVLRDAQNINWEKFILSLGFKLVTEARNSNSGNMIYVYHLVTLYR